MVEPLREHLAAAVLGLHAEGSGCLPDAVLTPNASALVYKDCSRLLFGAAPLAQGLPCESSLIPPIPSQYETY
jgi:hypothetical protein